MILVDSNVLIDVLEGDREWAPWSSEQIVSATTANDDLVYNIVAIAEVAFRFGSIDAFTIFTEALGLSYVALEQDAALAAGMAFVAYTRNRGHQTRRITLPDFFLGAHAQVLGARVLTRDPRFIRTYFPTVPLITPESAS